MRTSSPERTSQANGLSRLAVQGSQVEHCPVQVGCIPSSQHSVCDFVQFLVVPDVGHLGGDGEVAPQQPRHARVHQGVGLVVDEQECRVSHVLPDCRNAFECITIKWPLTGTGDHFLCQPKQRRCAPTPQPYWLQGLPELGQLARGNGFPAWKALQETGQEGTNGLSASALQQNLHHEQQVRTCPGFSPRECPAISREPDEQAAAKGWGSPSRERSTWSFLRSHVRMMRGRAPRRSSSPWII